MEPPLCIVLPPGIQPLLMAAGLIRKMAEDGALVVATEREHLSLLRRLFHDVDVTFWFDKADPATLAESLGLDVLALPADPIAMYTTAKVVPSHMYTSWDVLRDTAKEVALLDSVVEKHGPSFVLAWGAGLNRKLLPQGIPVVDAENLHVDNLIDYCGIMEAAMQVHAVDSWFLTLSDLLGGNTKRFCHTLAHPTTAMSCRRKYRKRVTIVCRLPATES